MTAPADRDPAAGTRVQSEYLLIKNAFGRVDGVLRRRRGAPSPVVLLETHPRSRSDANLSEWPCLDLPDRGIDTFAYNNRFSNSAAGTEVVTTWEQFALDVAAAVTEMRARGYRHVVLYGYSAGGPLVSFYQNVAEHGNAVFRGGDTIGGFRGFLAEGRELRLPGADGLILQNGTTGTGFSFLVRLDGSVVNEETGARDPSLDLFEPANGFDPERGSATYPATFLRRYFRAQCERMNRLVATAQEREAAVRAGRGRFTDSDVMVIPGVRAEPASVDLSLAARTRAPWPLFPDGQTTLVESNRRVVPSYAARNRRFQDGGTAHTLRSFLTYRAVRTDPDRHDPDAVTPATTGVDLASSNATTAGNLAGVTVPLLITAGTADTQVHLPQAELACNAATATSDRSIACINGAEHDMTPIDPAFGDTRAAHLEVLADWLSARYLPR
jgi:alpha-beta hydrolase superfamily lysophospholipase